MSSETATLILLSSPVLCGKPPLSTFSRLWIDEAGRDKDKDKLILVAFAPVSATAEDVCRAWPHADFRVCARADREERSSLLRLSQQLAQTRKLLLHRHFHPMSIAIYKLTGEERLENLNIGTLCLDPVAADNPMKIIYAFI